MNHKIDILDLHISGGTAKDAMKNIVQLMRTEPLSIVEILTADTLVKVEGDDLLKENIEQSDMVIPSEKYVLDMAGIAEKKRVQEVEERLFIKLFLNYLHKNKANVFLLTECEEGSNALRELLENHYGGIVVKDCLCVAKEELVDDLVVNRINSVEPDCVISVLKSPVQEAFVVRNRQLLNARLWLGAGKTDVLFPQSGISGIGVKRWIKKYILRREAVKEQQKKREND